MYLATILIIACLFGLSAKLLWQKLLPRPIRGIPYNEEAYEEIRHEKS
jgi:hypothetical protein